MMHMKDLVAAFAPHRGDAIVISARTGRYWMEHSDTPLDLPLGDPSMGGHAGFGLGLAMAQPNRRVVLFDSEGDILMNLGILTTIAEQAPANFYHFILDNECYATTGGQPVPNAKNVAYDTIARGCGIQRTFAFTELDDFARELPGVLRQPGPVFVWTKVYPEIENEPIGRRVRWRRRTADKVVEDARVALGLG